MCHQRDSHWTLVAEKREPYVVSKKRLEHIAEQESTYEGPDYDINWEEVRQGKAAGMPGSWKIEVSNY